MTFCIFCILLIVKLCCGIGFEGIEGEYCSKRPVYGPNQEVCCKSRDDECTMPILGNHLCYCDYFCLQHQGRDCCPDFYEVCLGQNRPLSTQPPDHEEQKDTAGCEVAIDDWKLGEGAIDNCLYD
uniref:SMB domain-containing protein n=1 Tax=Romanomermis culicivorax TaxID=13658 RepID=A0A915IGQ8_ROMCU